MEPAAHTQPRLRPGADQVTGPARCLAPGSRGASQQGEGRTGLAGAEAGLAGNSPICRIQGLGSALGPPCTRQAGCLRWPVTPGRSPGWAGPAPGQLAGGRPLSALPLPLPEVPTPAHPSFLTGLCSRELRAAWRPRARPTPCVCDWHRRGKPRPEGLWLRASSKSADVQGDLEALGGLSGAAARSQAPGPSGREGVADAVAAARGHASGQRCTLPAAAAAHGPCGTALS